MPQHLPEQLSDHVSVVRVDERLELPHSVNVDFEAEFSDACSVSTRTRVPLESPGVVAADVSPFSSNNAAVLQSLKVLPRMVRELDSGNRALSEMRILETPTFGPARKEKLAEVLATVRGFTRSVSLDDIFEQEAYALTVRNLVVQTQALAAPILPVVTRDRLTAIDVGNLDIASASLAKAELDALVPLIEDHLDSIENQPATLLPGSLEQLLRGRDLAPVSEEVKRALNSVSSDPPVAITAANAAIESLLKVYCDDRELAIPNQSRKTNSLLRAVIRDLGLDPSNQAEEAIQGVLQGLRSVVHSMADLRASASSAHGDGRSHRKPKQEDARLAVQASQAFIEFFVNTWNDKYPCDL